VKSYLEIRKPEMLVLKVGGNEIDDPNFLTGFAQAVAGMPETPVIVHGGGKEIADLQLKFGLTPRFVEGLRVTDEQSLAIAEMILSGRVNKRIVAALLQAGVDALGLSGVDRGLVRVEKMQHPAGDLGRVGKVVAVRGEVLQNLGRSENRASHFADFVGRGRCVQCQRRFRRVRDCRHAERGRRRVRNECCRRATR
jgi:acetylglutamate kinase